MRLVAFLTATAVVSAQEGPVTMSNTSMSLRNTSMTLRNTTMFVVYQPCLICQEEGSTLLTPDLSVIGTTCAVAQVAGKIGFVANCTAVRQACACTNGSSSSGATTSPSTIGSVLSWAELVGMDGPSAKRIIESQMPNLHVVLLPWGGFYSSDYRTDRVRIFVDEETGEVKEEPRIG